MFLPFRLMFLPFRILFGRPGRRTGDGDDGFWEGLLIGSLFTEVEQRDFMRSFIERIDIYPEKPDNGCWIRNIVFNFPMPVQGQEIKSLPLEPESTVEVCILPSICASYQP